MATLTVKEVLVNIYPEDLADIFCQFNPDEKAEFFNHLAHYFPEETYLDHDLRMCKRSKLLTEDGKFIMKLIGEEINGN